MTGGHVIVDIPFIVKLFSFLLHYYQKSIVTVSDKVNLNNLNIKFCVPKG
jgi:hypothetical protein